MTPMDSFEYFRMKLELFPQDIIEEYELRDKVDADGNVFCAVQRGMYGLPQAGIIAQELLTKQLHQAGYRQSKVTPGYWHRNSSNGSSTTQQPIRTPSSHTKVVT